MSTFRVIGPEPTTDPREWTAYLLDRNPQKCAAFFQSERAVYLAAHWLDSWGDKRVRTWARKWLADPQNDCYRARGAHIWQVMCWIDAACYTWLGD